MKNYHLLLLGLLMAAAPTGSKGGCPCNNIQTPALPKPAGASIVSASCSELVVGWKGLAGQDYVVRVSWLDPVTGGRTEMDPITDIRCDRDMNCSAAIPVTGGRQVSWTVQAVRIEGDRTYYSYPLRGGRDYPVPGCEDGNKPGMNSPQHGGMNSRDETKMIIFPNPVHTILNIAFNKPVGQAVLRIFDMNGRTVLTQQAGAGDMQINVSSLSSGSYMAVMEEGAGKVIYTARFAKD